MNLDNWKSKNSNVINEKNANTNDSVVRELYSGIRLTNPLISSDELRLLMQGRKMIKLSAIKTQINSITKDIDNDWVTIGIVINKTTKVSKNGNEYSLWKLSDLKSDKTVSFFLFGLVNERHWKLAIGSVIGLLNASILGEKKEYRNKSTDLCSVTIDDPDKLLNIGTSKDMGYCKAVKKNGEVCGSLIAKSEDEYCLYHIKNAYRKFSSKRAEIQSNFANKEPEDYYFANNFTPNAALNEKNIVFEMKTLNKAQLVNKRETEMKNMERILSNPLSKAAQNLAAFTLKPKTALKSCEVVAPLSAKDVLNHIGGTVNQVPKNASPAIARGYKRGQSIDLKVSASDMSAAKRRAIEIFKNKPTASPVGNSPSVKSKKLQDILSRVNQSLSQSNDEFQKEQEEKERQKSKLIEEALGRRSVNEKLVQAVESEAEERYFHKLEKKESYERRLENVKELKVKVVTCADCQYTAVAQSDHCKLKQHQVTFHQAVKRFFSCKNCQTRTFSFNNLVPTLACNNCGQHSYEKASIINVSQNSHTSARLTTDFRRSRRKQNWPINY